MQHVVPLHHPSKDPTERTNGRITEAATDTLNFAICYTAVLLSRTDAQTDRTRREQLKGIRDSRLFARARDKDRAGAGAAKTSVAGAKCSPHTRLFRSPLLDLLCIFPKNTCTQDSKRKQHKLYLACFEEVERLLPNAISATHTVV